MGILGSWLEIKPAVHRCLKPAALCLYSFPQLERAVVLLQGLQTFNHLPLPFKDNSGIGL